MRILVTGATGFVGSNLCEKLVNSHDVIGISRSMNVENVKELLTKERFKLVKCDLSDYSQIKSTFSKNKIDAVFHLAVNWGSKEDPDNPIEIFNDNVGSTLNLLYACQQNGIKKFIYASTMNVYGDAEYLPLDEGHKTKPTNFYGLSKLIGELYCRFYHDKYDINTIILRCSGIFGPKRIGGAVANFLQKAINNDDIIVNNDGNYVWDMVYVKDVVEAYIENLKKIDEIKYGEFNIGCGPNGVMLKDLIEKIVKLTGSKSNVEFKDEPGNFKFYYSIEKAKKVLGFNPRSLEDALSDYIKHITNATKDNL